MKAIVLEGKQKLNLRDIDIKEALGPDDVRIKIHTVGICGSDVHYFEHGKIGPYIVNEPMVLGHEASGTVIETGAHVKHLKIGDRVCMEPGIPDPQSRETILGMYNLDPAVRFWATPPVHGCLRETVVHPAQFAFKLPDSLGYDEGAMAEPLSVGLQAAKKAQIKPGDTALVTGCGTIGLMCAMAALSGGCSRVIISDLVREKLDLAAMYGFIPIDINKQDLIETVKKETDGWGVDVILEASGSESVISRIFEPLRPGGRVVFVGIPVEPARIDLVAAQSKEASMETVFRYAHVYPRALALMASKLNVKPLITDRYDFAHGLEAFEYAANPRPETVKVVISL